MMTVLMVPATLITNLARTVADQSSLIAVVSLGLRPATAIGTNLGRLAILTRRPVKPAMPMQDFMALSMPTGDLAQVGRQLCSLF